MSVLAQLKTAAAGTRRRWTADEEVTFFTMTFVDQATPAAIEEELGRSKLGYPAKKKSLLKRVEAAELAEDHTVEDIYQAIRDSNSNN